jgi:hypothetical protein
MAIIWYIGQTDPDTAILYAMVYAMMWSIILALTALCFGPGWWRWTSVSTYVTITVGPALGLWSLVIWLTFSFFVRLFPTTDEPDEW